MSIATLSPRALYEEVAELLRQRIFSDELAPGSWIDEAKIAEEFGISRTPLREALKVLASEGLITMKVRRGAWVTEVTHEDMKQVYHLLALLESDAAAWVAEFASDLQRAELHALHAELEQATLDRKKFFGINEQFHMRILEATSNKWLFQMVQDLRRVMKLSRHNSLLKSGRIADSLAEHASLMAAFDARDAEAARKAMQSHFAEGLNAAG
ncbi:GntR family transcriptional regulator [Diaphorobacter aerolatus]|uniref:GntR family transcriptional regulator n=1 Tax=Diaphorobacter aerolatus TaxID=1288495 RepID=A0A7H0GL09_9BURK|nr:GntR family transcriptional regulator [Diaphorobacter aerolatus]QNP48975.1 GntR family transcriptional regulator [Diaphorobacter aerolatus]